MKDKLLVIGMFSVCSNLLFAQQNQFPNIVYILVDDLGYSDLSFVGEKAEVHTPNIDRLAREGMYFTNAYSASPVSSPTRACIMTGKYPAEMKLTCHIPGMGTQKYIRQISKGYRMKEAFFEDHLDLKEKTIAHCLKEQGYQTAFIGKWHLAGEGSIYTQDGIVNTDYHPDKYGFDINIAGCAYGQPASYFSPYKNAVLKDGAKGEYLTDRLGDEAVKYIENASRDNPFFVYLAFYAVHTPYQVPEEMVKKNNGNKYNGLIQKMDENVGKVLNCLKKQKLEENTLVIFYSDNGGVFDNFPLRGYKGDLLEGGIRVPLIVKWTGKIKKGSICHEPVHSIDFLPTFQALLNKPIDTYSIKRGCSILPLLLGKQEKMEERTLFWHYPHHRKGTSWAMGSAVRKGDWKLIQLMETNEIKLFNLKDDLSEQNDLSELNPKKAFELLKDLDNWRVVMNAEMPFWEE